MLKKPSVPPPFSLWDFKKYPKGKRKKCIWRNLKEKMKLLLHFEIGNLFLMSWLFWVSIHGCKQEKNFFSVPFTKEMPSSLLIPSSLYFISKLPTKWHHSLASWLDARICKTQLSTTSTPNTPILLWRPNCIQQRTFWNARI